MQRFILNKIISKGDAFGAKFEILELKGLVIKSNIRSETDVSGSIERGDGSITSKTTNFQDLFLKDTNGQEHVIQLTDFIIPCIENQKLTLFSAFQENQEKGYIFFGINHTTNNKYKFNKSLRESMFPTNIFVKTTLVFTLFIVLYNLLSAHNSLGDLVLSIIFGVPIFGIVLFIIGILIGYIRSLIILKNDAFKSYVSNLHLD